MNKREKIFNAAAKLFADSSFDRVGIRDIAAAAGVNSAMISYYFGGKKNLLREVFSRFAALLLEDMERVEVRARSLYDLFDRLVPSQLKLARDNRDVYLVGLRQLNQNDEDLRELRADFHEKVQELFSRYLRKLGMQDTRGKKVKQIIFMASIGMVFSTHLLGGGSGVEGAESLEEYASVITGMLKHGVPSMIG